MNDPRKITETSHLRDDEDKRSTRDPYETVPGESSSPSRPAAVGGQLQRIGRYRIEQVLGEGGFGRVYRGYDEELKRRVAIKVPHPQRVSQPEDVEQYLAEAQVLASLDHPAIVPVYDVGRTDDGLCYVVSKLIEGSDLAERIQRHRPSHGESADVVARVAEALHYAHTNGLVHRDIKPANLLIDASGDPYVADFGLALKEEDIGRGSGWAGTPSYMSPEQARGEGHRVDGRSDIFSLGVVFYELLTGKRPFQGNTSQELLDQISSVEARPLRQRDDRIPKELERICLKALAKKVSARYMTAKDMAEDLRHHLSVLPQAGTESASPLADSGAVPSPAPTSDSRPVRMVPKGLRSFDEHDADFFLELLPGPRDRGGLPDSIRFWKTRIEQTDADETFPVGLIYGPSGCGKSSLVKAGLLPRLSDDVVSVYVEATPDETESRLLRGLRKKCPELPEHLDLKDTLAALRRGHGLPKGKKVLIVLDQFEQWLHAQGEAEDDELVRALRQCDGGRLQAVLMVRDDFWLAISRFMKSLEIRLLEGRNSSLVDLFDTDHARRILKAFGRAFGRLPPSSAELSDGQQEFLKQAVSGLADEGKVICVRLALFAEMMKGKPWTPATLKQVGGTQGIGVTFLEETFSASTAPPDHRYHQKAARAVLKALLPESGTDIKGHMHSGEELLNASGYARSPHDFQDLINILDGGIRLVTPTDPEGHDAEAEAASRARAGQKYYQLTHDYLVPALRDWLTRKQKETRRGRAELLLAERAALWNGKPENRHLPSGWEYLSIVGLTARKSWSGPQRQMMRQAGRMHGMRAAVGIALLLLLAISGASLRQNFAERTRQTRTQGLVASLQTANIGQVHEIVEQLKPLEDLAVPLLRQRLTAAEDGTAEKLNLSLGLLRADSHQVEFLYEQLLQAEADQFPVIRDFLAPHKDQLIDRLWRMLDSREDQSAQQRLQAAAALATYDPTSAEWESVNTQVAAELIAAPVSFLSDWKEAFRPIAGKLVWPLVRIYLDQNQPELARSLATSLLADYARDDTNVLAGLVYRASQEQFTELFPPLSRNGSDAIEELLPYLDRRAEPSWNDPPLDPGWVPVPESLRRAIESAEGIVEERFAFCQTMLLDKCVEVTESLRPSGYRPLRFRPYSATDGLRVAAIWTRDARAWWMVHDLTAEQTRAKDAEMQQQGLMPLDVSGYVTRDQHGQLANRYAAVWAEWPEYMLEVRMYLGVPASSELSHYGPWREEGFNRHTASGFFGHDGVHYRSAVWSQRNLELKHSSQRHAGILEPHFTAERYLGRLLTELTVSPTRPPQSDRQQNAEELVSLEAMLAEKPDDATLRKRIAKLRFQLQQDEQALEDLNWLIEQLPDESRWYHYRAIVHARAQRANEARQDLARYRQLSQHVSQPAYLDAVVSAHLGEDAEGTERLEAAVSQAPGDEIMLYNASCAYSLMSAVFAGKDAAKSRVYAERAVALLPEAVAAGWDDYEHILRDRDLYPLREHPAFLDVLAALKLDRKYEAVWNVNTGSESTELHGLAPHEHLRRCRELILAGYRPAAISVAALPDSNSLATASVWHRNLVMDATKETLAKRQANAAVALLRMGRGDCVWPLLKHSTDPRLRSYLINQLAPLGADPQAILQQLETEQDVSVRRALILILGDFEEQQMTTAERERLAAEFLETYASHPDAGIHAAIQWTLHRWGKRTQLQERDRELAVGKLEGSRQWYVNKQRQTLVVVPGPVEFVMGSPVYEEGRDGLVEGRWEEQHRKRINRTFAIMTHEVTVDQFLKFSPDYGYTKSYARDGDHPINVVTWYAAAEYCNWLSKQEGIPQEEWCYLPNEDNEFAEGMKPAPDYLQRRGYRLPTAAEWEYACRAGAITSRYYGETDDLLGQYAWVATNSNFRRMLPVASLKPNELGLFDMLGNAAEWCHDAAQPYRISRTGGSSEDLPVVSEVLDSQTRALRGGSFRSGPGAVRCALRYGHPPTYRYFDVGMRVARTYPESP